MKHRDAAADERLSAMVDGELHGTELADGLTHLLADEGCEADWLVYHLIGDVLRSEDLTGNAGDAAFFQNLQQLIAQEPLPSASREHIGNGRLPFGNTSNLPQVSANADVFRWRLIAGLACTVLVGVLGIHSWESASRPSDSQVVTITNGQSENLQAAAATEVVDSDGMIRDARLEQMLNAHQQFGGHSALQKPAGFLRNATYERPGK